MIGQIIHNDWMISQVDELAKCLHLKTKCFLNIRNIKKKTSWWNFPACPYFCKSIIYSRWNNMESILCSSNIVSKIGLDKYKVKQ